MEENSTTKWYDKQQGKQHVLTDGGKQHVVEQHSQGDSEQDHVARAAGTLRVIS